MKHFKKIDKHLKYDELIIVALASFIAGFFLKNVGSDGRIIEVAFGLLGVIVLFLAIIDYVRHKSSK
jgi:uncharacterized membrane protein YjjP (DUF1212 family)